MVSRNGVRSENEHDDVLDNDAPDEYAQLQVIDARGHAARLVDDAFIDIWLPCLSGVQVKVYLYLLRNAWNGRDENMTTDVIARRVGHKHLSVCASLVFLQSHKLIRKLTRRGKGQGDTLTTYTILPVPTLSLTEMKHVREENVAIPSKGAINEQQETLFDADECGPVVAPKKKEVPRVKVASHVATHTTDSEVASFSEDEYTKLATEFLRYVETLIGGIADWPTERRAARMIVRLPCEPTLEELQVTYEKWYRGRGEQYGYTLRAYSKSVGRMIQDMRETAADDASGVNPMRQSAERYAQRARGLFNDT